MSFDKELDKAAKLVLAASEKTVRGVALELFGAIITDSPVATGRFRGNWQTTISSPASGKVDVEDKDDTIARAKMNKVVAEYKINESMFMTNNLEYAQKLEDSHPQKAGWVKANIANFKVAVDSQARKNKI